MVSYIPIFVKYGNHDFADYLSKEDKMETHILFILAGALIAILLGVSIWSARREKSRIFSNTFSTRPPSTPINTGFSAEVPPTLAAQGTPPSLFNNNETSTVEKSFNEIRQQEIEKGVKEIKISLPEQEPLPYASNNEVESMDHSQEIKIEIPQPRPEIAQSVAEDMPHEEPQSQIITLYVVAAEGQQFSGELVVQHLEALGLQFGEYNIFHRHLDNPSSPVLFSAANMMQPGIFDLTQIQRFSTVGLVFFMHLPSIGNDLTNLKLMIRTVESFAQSVGGFVLDEQRQLFDEAARQAYLLQVTQQ